jgi:hypothetical protein
MSWKQPILLVIVFFTAVAAYGASTLAEAKITVSVVDEARQPIASANVSVAFYAPRSATDLWQGLKAQSVNGKTDTNGIFVATGKTAHSVRLAVSRQGYYESIESVKFSSQECEKWVPYNPTVDIVLRAQEAPRPLYAKMFQDVELPAEGEAVGYDLVLGDWTSPYGEGVQPDLTFSLIRDYKSRFDYASTFTIAVSGRYDGFVSIPTGDVIQNSGCVFPRYAPEGGYTETKLVLKTIVQPGQVDKHTCSLLSQNLFFRVRTKVDENGRIQEANYGKLVGPIECGLHDTKTGKLRLTYYLNPDVNDRNLEFDPLQNLFKNLGWFEQVKKP